MSKKLNVVGMINKGFVCGKYLSPHLQDVLFQKIGELEGKGNKEFWQAYKKGIEIGIAEYRHEQLKKVHQIKSREDDFDRSR